MKRWLICQVWAFFLSIPLCSEFTTAHNRYLLYWTAAHMWVYLAMVASLGTVLFGIGTCVRKFFPKAYQPFVIGCAVLSPLSLAWLTYWPFIGVVILAVVVYFIGLTAQQVLSGLARSTLFMVFMLPIFIFTGFSYSTFPTERDKTPSDVPERKPTENLHPAGNVYWFIFDEWSYRLTMNNGKPQEWLPNLRQLSEKMCVFTDAHSAGCHTLFAVPRLLFERRDLYALHDGVAGFWKDDQFLPSGSEKSVFTKAKQRGFRSYMVGWHHNYQAMLGDQPDYLFQVASTELDDATPLGLASAFGQKWIGRLFGPQLSSAVLCSDYQQRNYGFLRQNEQLLDKTRQVLADTRKTGQFAVFHLPLPHGPFIYDRHGNVKSLTDQCRWTSVDDYKDHLMYLDKVIGTFAESLKKQGKYDDAVFVLMSDHTWRNDTEIERTGESFSHVPLMIHLPGQQRYVRVDERFTTLYLLELLDYWHDNKGILQDLNRVVGDRDWYFPIPDKEVGLEKIPSK